MTWRDRVPRAALPAALWGLAALAATGFLASSERLAALPGLPSPPGFLRGTLRVLPLVAFGLWFLGRWARAHGGKDPAAPWQPWALAGAIGLAFLAEPLALPAAESAIAAGLAALLLLRVAQLLLALRPALGKQLPRRPPWPFFALPLLVYLAIAPWATSHRAPDGDEPYYLMVTHSLAYDLDADLANNYARQDSLRFMARAIEPQPGDPVGTHGEKYSRHNELLPLALAPAYRAFGPAGAQSVMAIFTAALCWLALRSLRHYAPKHPGEALLAYGLLAFASPLLLYAHQIWVEVPAALCALLALDQIRDLRPHRGWDLKQWLGIALPLVLLPLLKLRFILLALPLLGLAWWHAGRPRKPLIVVAGLLSAVLTGVLIHNLVVFGNPLKIHTFEEIDPLRYTPGNVWRGLFGLFFDCGFGLFAFFPIWLLMVPALWRRTGETRRALLDLLWSSGPYLLMLLPRREWFGGWSPPFRYALVTLPLIAALLIPALAERRRAGGRFLIAMLGTWTGAALLLWLIVPGWTYNFADGRSYLLDAISSRAGADVARFFPSGTRPATALYLVPPLAIVAAFLIWKVRAPRWRAAAGAAGLSAALASVAVVPWLARALPTRVIEFEDPWVRKSGGHVHPDRWTYDRPLYQGGWTLRGGESVAAPVIANGTRLLLRLTFQYVRNTPAPIALVLRDGQRELARHTPMTPDIWLDVTLGPFAWTAGRELVLAAEGPASETPLAGLILDRAVLEWD
jgi:hypothetical protein